MGLGLFASTEKSGSRRARCSRRVRAPQGSAGPGRIPMRASARCTSSMPADAVRAHRRHRLQAQTTHDAPVTLVTEFPTKPCMATPSAAHLVRCTCCSRRCRPGSRSSCDARRPAYNAAMLRSTPTPASAPALAPWRAGGCRYGSTRCAAALGLLAANLIGGYPHRPVSGAVPGPAAARPAWRLLLVTGFLGALTTFSTFSARCWACCSSSAWRWPWAWLPCMWRARCA